MATNCARNIVRRSVNTFFCRAQSQNSAPSKLSGLSPPRRPSFSVSRLPVELGCGESLMPLHSVIASALLKSKLSSKVGHWASLSEGFATPL